MRDKNMLAKFEDIKLLQSWFYMSEENTIVVKNSLGIETQIRMNDEMHFLGKCLSSTYLSLFETDITSDMNIIMQLAIIEQLKVQPAKEFPERFTNRWDEIKEMCRINLYENMR